MWSPFCNPFIFTFMHVMGVCTPLLNVRTFKSANRSSAAVVERRSRSGRDVSACSDLSSLFSYSCALFCAFLHAAKTQLFSFQAFPHSLPKTTRGGGCPLMTRGQNETTNAKFRRSIPSSRTSHYRWSSGPFGWDGGREGASARKNHWMGCREVTGCNSFQPWSASWT